MNNSVEEKIDSCIQYLKNWESGIHSYHITSRPNKCTIILHSTEDIRDKQQKYTNSLKDILDEQLDQYIIESEATDGLLKITITHSS